MEEFELIIDQDLLNPDYENLNEPPFPVWKLYAKVNGRLFEYTKEHWMVQAGAQEAQKTIGLTVTSSVDLDENWSPVK